jgi:hypothetical protein
MRVRCVNGARALLAVASLSLALVVAPATALAVRTLGLSSGSFHFDVAAGGEASGEVTVLNSGTEPLSVMVYAADQKVDSKGNVTYQTPNKTEIQSAALPSSWTTIKMPANSKSLGNIPYLVIQPGERVPVTFSITVPASVPAGDHNVLIFFESFVPPTPATGQQSKVSGRLGTRITLRVAGDLVHKLEVRPFDVPSYVIGGEVPFDFLVRNVGNVDERVGARVLLLDRSDNEIQRKTAIDGLTVFAGTNIEASGTLVAEKMPIGPFKVRLDVSPVDDKGKALGGGADTITESHEVWLIPYWVIALAGVLALLIVVGIIGRIATTAARRRILREQQRVANAPTQM